MLVLDYSMNWVDVFAWTISFGFKHTWIVIKLFIPEEYIGWIQSGFTMAYSHCSVHSPGGRYTLCRVPVRFGGYIPPMLLHLVTTNKGHLLLTLTPRHLQVYQSPMLDNFCTQPGTKPSLILRILCPRRHCSSHIHGGVTMCPGLPKTLPYFVSLSLSLLTTTSLLTTSCQPATLLLNNHSISIPRSA